MYEYSYSRFLCLTKKEDRMILENNFYIITGGPGVGKTRLIDELQLRGGCNCVPEVAREIIKDQVKNNGDALPWLNAQEYSKLMLAYSVRDFIRLSDTEELHFFDRGIPDTYGYEQLMKFDYNEELHRAINQYRYNKIVFMLPPWKEIYETDSERKQSFEIAVETYQTMKTAYTSIGYELIEVPHLPVSERVNFIINMINFVLLKKMNLLVVNYDSQWVIEYAEESQKIKEILGNELVEIYHIGSTSVENLKSKPIIDMMPVVKNINEVDKYNPEFEKLGYEPMGELGMVGRRYFRKGGDDRTHQIHIFQQGDNHNIIRHLAVRGYLREHPKVVKQYGDLKSQLAKQFPNDIAGYCDGKESFMQDLEAKALAWYKG